MTRWIQEFEQSPFKRTWAALLEAVEQLDVDDKTVATTVEELARLRKALTFLDRVIISADLELTPRSVWSSCDGQAQGCLGQVRAYESSRDASHLTNANENVDNLLTYVRPYMVVPEQAIDALGAAVHSFSEQVSDYARAVQERGAAARHDLAAAVAGAQTTLYELEQIRSRAQGIDAYLFDGIDGNNGADTFVRRTVSEIQAHSSEIQATHDRLTVGPSSTVAEIGTAETQIREMRDRLKALTESADAEHKDLELFYARIFGKPADDDSGRRDGGLKAELDDRLNQLSTFEKEHRTRHDAMFAKVEALLPGAASAGLASAYKTMKDSFATSVSRYTRAFYGALGLLLVGGLTVVTDSVSFSPLQIKLVQSHDWQEMLRSMLTRVPVIIPLVWIAVFSATRRSQYERLQQEYAHKESLASSYESYKKQLQDLKVNAEELQQALIAKAIDAIAYNASVTLDGKHAEKPPVVQLLEKLSLDDAKKLMELLRQKNPA